MSYLSCNFNILYELKKKDKKSLEEILFFIEWCKLHKIDIYLCGSSVCGDISPSSDFDLIIIVDIKNNNIKNNFLPNYFDNSYWNFFIKKYYDSEIDIFATHHIISDRIKLELYPVDIFKKILEFQKITIRRVRRGPLREKNIILNSIDGERMIDVIYPFPVTQKGIFSKTENIIILNKRIFIGIHIEKILCSKHLLLSQQNNIYITEAWKNLKCLMSKIKPLPYCGKLEEIFLFHQS
ncbi:nucleotidyltransferase domain-containing protein [Candidatus Electronema sp. JM]|uniref:nucleotidyltransferase domain-containing protein n=1 Tax=Candidatus Electronema sp. JM TaxID=3401571 RepID=UPI003AA946E0